ncbi:ABC transporter permease subunit [Pseudobacter ginsenosidimutans]|uniref:ABC-2 type transport system permease protein n=1 Tax=Pseudobacter ginsenosidimutans TaxID=661488 RepID=A0A4Q7N3L3_9BACT|nr:Gldg family protein [Pseudobacter ginsenosidimutans]QEC43964.1 ABC transporter permease subunit [Pseudobacter ginsenosidimutans]RZS75398.1 ABC-2 type transport system permease protein [Pseudobacter ginsenosidimutans]
MKIIFKIARAELRNLFYSPIAWVTLVVFFVISGMQFINPLRTMAIQQELLQANSPGWNGFRGPLTFALFNDTIKHMLQYLYFFLPLLTMGVINREVNSGTMKLLNSSPVSIREIVMGKFLGLTGFNLALMSVIALMLFTGYFTIQHAEFAWYCSMLLGFFLLTSTYMAIGLYISTLTSYQIVAGIATFFAFIILGMMGKIGQEYDLFRDITWFISLAGRTDFMFNGLITTRDLFYFLLVIVLFLGLTTLKLKSLQESKKWTVSFTRHLLLILTVLTLGYFSSRPGHIGYLDVTSNKLNTLDSTTQGVLKELDGSPLTVTLYANLLGRGYDAGSPASRNAYIWGFWEKYIRFYPNIQFKYEYYYDIKKGDSGLFKSYPGKTIHQIAKQVARMFKVDLADLKKPGAIDTMTDLSREDQWKLIMELEYKGNKSLLRIYDMPIWPDPSHVSASIRKLTRNNIPKVMFTTGNWERSPWRNGEREYGLHTNLQAKREAMTNMGLDADTISLLRHDIPANTKLLAVADPRSALQPSEQEKILQYIENGGNAIFYGEAGKQQILNPILNTMGVTLENGRLVRPHLHAASDAFRLMLNKAGVYLAQTSYMQSAQKFGVEKAAPNAVFSGFCDISFKDTNGFKIEPIIQMPGAKNIWIENGLYVADSAKPIFSPEEGDLQKEVYTIGLKLTRMINNKEQRIIVTSDADFMTVINSIELGLYSWLVYNEYPVYIPNIYHKDRWLTIGKNPAKVLWYVYAYGLPGLLLLTGTILLIRRKRK